MKKLKNFWSDEKGLTTLEVIVGTLLLCGAVVLMGYALTAGLTGKTGDFIGDLEELEANHTVINELSAYTYTIYGQSSKTGMAIRARGDFENPPFKPDKPPNSTNT